MLKNVPYSTDVVLPTDTPKAMLDHVLSLDRVGVLVEKDNFGEIIRLERNSAVLMTYYRNNIQHLFVFTFLLLRVSFYIMKQSKRFIIGCST